MIKEYGGKNESLKGICFNKRVLIPNLLKKII